MILKYLIQKEIIQMKRNIFVPRLILIFPIMIMLVIPWVTNMEVKNIGVSIVDNDHSTRSTRLIHEIEASHYFIYKGMNDTYEDGIKDIERSKSDVVMVIPRHYGKNTDEGKAPRVFIAANSVNGTKGSLGASYLSQIINNKGGKSYITSKLLYNPHQDYKVNMIPALMAMVIIMLCGFLPALNIVGEKEVGTIEQINVTPVKKWQFILAKLIPYWVIGLVDLTVCIILSWLVYGITPAGNIGFIYLGAILLSITFSSLGLIVSNYSNALQEAMFVMWFILVCMMLLSGLFTPARSMPLWAQYLTFVSPVRYFIDLMRTVFIRGAGFAGIYMQIFALTGISVILGSWAVVSYRKNN